MGALAIAMAGREHFPRYQSPFIRTSTNHYALWASRVYLAGIVFGNGEWEELGGRVMEALRRGTEFQMYFTWPDGTPVEVINDRNRRWRVDPWGQFGFSRFSVRTPIR